MIRNGARIAVGMLVCTLGCATAPTPGKTRPQAQWALDCVSVFTPTIGAKDLAQRFGAANVRDIRIDIGEGFQESGTVLFPDSADLKVEIIWADTLNRRTPRSVRVRGEATRWRAPHGLTLGMDLQTVERMNLKPFRLMGFAWDYEGTVVSWNGGALASPDSSACRVRARLRPDGLQVPPEQEKWFMQVQGDHEFSSGHRAMQALNPRVYEVWLEYAQ